MSGVVTQRGFLWSAVAQGGIRAIALARGLVLARLLMPEEFGIFGMAQIFVGFVWVAADIGFSGYLTQLPDDEHFDRRRDTILTLQLIWTGSLGLLAAALAPLAPRFLPELTGRMGLIALVVIGNAAQAVMLTLLALLRRQYDWRADTAIQLSAHVVNLAVAVILAVYGAGAYALAWGWTALSLVGVVLGAAAAVKEFRPVLDRPSLDDFRSYAGGYFGQAALWFVMFNIDNAIIALRLGTRDLGLYAMAFNYGTMLPMAFGALIANVALPTFAGLKADPAKMAEAYRLIARIGAPWIVPVLCIVVPLGDRLMPILFGLEWVEAGLPFQLLLAAGCARAILPSVQVFWATGRTRTPLVIVAAAMTPAIPLLWWVAPQGIAAVAGTMLGYYIFVETLHTIAALRILKIHPIELIALTGRVTVSGCVVAAGLLAVKPYLSGTWSLLGALTAGTAAYIALVAWVAPRARADARLIVARHDTLLSRAGS